MPHPNWEIPKHLLFYYSNWKREIPFEVILCLKQNRIELDRQQLSQGNCDVVWKRLPLPFVLEENVKIQNLKMKASLLPVLAQTFLPSGHSSEQF